MHFNREVSNIKIQFQNIFVNNFQISKIRNLFLLIVAVILAIICIQFFVFSSLNTNQSYLKRLKISLKQKLNFNLIKQNFNKSKWIVITTINEATQQIKKLSIQNEFSLLVVGDLKTNQSWSHNNSIYLNAEKQLNFDFKSVLSTPFNSYTRKNIGYLYAIQNGAKFIYDTDDDNEPISQINDFFHFEENRTELEYDSNSPLVLNTYAHFGQPTIWPRGYPLNRINQPFYNNYICSKKPTSLIQQSVVNGDPDVDAIFRLTKSLGNKRIDLYFDDTSPSVRIPKYKLTPFNSQNTLYHYKAFWALYLPHSVSFRLTDIWRSYWSQRLLWLLDSTISFYGPNAYQLRNIHSYMSDYEQEANMFLKTEKLIDFLYKWKCKFDKFYSCVIDLSKKMAENDFWHRNEIESIKNWLEDLNSIGYVEPNITNTQYEMSNLTIETFLKNINISSSNHYRVKYTPEFQLPLDVNAYYANGMKKFKKLEKQETISYLLNYCKSHYKLNYNLNNLDKFENKSNMILLVTFNHMPILENIAFLSYFHRNYFRNIVFCGYNIINIAHNSSNFKKYYNLTLIEFHTNSGYLHYECMSKLIDLNFRTDGILLMSDDVLLKPWNFNSLNREKYIFISNPTCLFEINPTHQSWPSDVSFWMSTAYGNIAVRNLSANLEKILNKEISTSTKDYQIYASYLKVLQSKSNSTSSNKLTKVCKLGSDAFYVPMKHFYEFNLISKFFSENKVFLEFAVPTILSGLVKDNSYLEQIDIYYNWGGQYDLNVNSSNTKYMAHPFKITHYNAPKQRLKICQLYVQENLNNF